ncbi:MAG: TFIIB-type zinc ribbon-containing protein, partial [Thermofilum sp.]
MLTCPECGGRAVETTEFLVCGSCGLVLGQLIEEGCYWPNATWVLVEAAERFGVDFDECLQLYRTAVGKGVARGTALAVAIYAALRRRGEHVPLKRICEWLNSRGVAANHAQALRV